jgi:hypothetical protein
VLQQKEETEGHHLLQKGQWALLDDCAPIPRLSEYVTLHFWQKGFCSCDQGTGPEMWSVSILYYSSGLNVIL